MEKVAPSSIAAGARALRRVDDILEHHSREHSIDHRSRSRARQKLLDLREDPVAGVVVEKEKVIRARNLDQSGAGNARGQFAAAFDADQGVIRAVHNQGRNLNRMKNA